MKQTNLLQSIKISVLKRLADKEDPDLIRIEILGRKGKLTEILRSISKLSLEEKRNLGTAANQLKEEISLILNNAEKKTASIENFIDRTIPAVHLDYGSIHPISAMIEEMVGIFQDLSFEVVEGNEIVSEKDNFESLNMGKDHPARDGQDSFYLNREYLLRTQMSAVQVVKMSQRLKNKEMPIRMIAPGKTYRRESDLTHSSMFHQIEGVLVDSQTTFANLRGTLDYFVNRLFDNLVETRFRPHYFPFTEPSAEMDLRWKGKTKEGSAWIEFGGCGMIHPDVLKRAGINPRVYQGWAFGMSIERPIMLRNQISDIRRFYDNSSSFLVQFPS